MTNQLRVQAVEWSLLSPVLVLTGTLLALLLAFVLAPTRGKAHGAILLAGLAAAAALVVPAGQGSTFCSTQGCSYEVGGFTIGLQLLTLIAGFVAALLLMNYPGTAQDRAQWWALLVAATLGSLAVIGARDLFTLLIALETATLPVVGLVALTRTAEAATAATRLLLVSVGSFGFSLLGTALIYTGSGSVYLSAISRAVNEAGALASLVVIGALLFTCGVGYKVALLPFGLWAADVYPSAPVPIAAFLSTASKVAGVLAAALVLVLAVPAGGGWWLGAAIAIAMTLANVVALIQQRALSLIAWSTMAQGAWALLPVAAARPGARLQVLGAVSGYLVAYLAASLTLFAVVMLISRHHPAGRTHTLKDERGLIRHEPVATVLLILALLSLAGLPPGVAGLVAKILALRPVLDADLLWLAVVAAINVVIALAYYLRWVWLLVMPDPKLRPDGEHLHWKVTVTEGLALTLSGAILVVLTVLPGLLV